MILFNKWLFTAGHFPFPLFLITCHMLITSISVRILCLLASRKSSELGLQLEFMNASMPVRPTLSLSWNMWASNILPIGILLSISMICANISLLSLSVSFIQMMKAMSPVVVLGLSSLLLGDTPSKWKLVNVACIGFGVFLTAIGELQFSASGFVLQSIAIIADGLRIVLIQKLITPKGLNLDPMTALYHIAPIGAVLNFVAFVLIEYSSFYVEFLQGVGSFPLILSCGVALIFNVLSIHMIGKFTSMMATFSTFLKDIFLIIASTILFGTQITVTQATGYTMALVGLFLFRNSSLIFAKSDKSIQYSCARFIKYIITLFCLCLTLLCIALFSGPNSQDIVYFPGMTRGNIEFIDKFAVDGPPRKTALFFFSAGENGKQNINEIVTRIGFEDASYVVQIYDNSTWTEFGWIDKVLLIRAPKQTKVWGIRRFLTPELVSNYDYVLPWDEGVYLREDFDFDAYIGILKKYNIYISHPAFEDNYEFPVMSRIKHSIIGHWSNFIQMTAPIIHTDAWRSCVYNLFHPNIRLGWGIDGYLYRLCRDTKYCRMAIIDAYPVIYRDITKQSEHSVAQSPQQGGKSGLFDEGMEEMMAQRSFIGQWCQNNSKHYLCRSWKSVRSKRLDRMKIIDADDAGRDKCIDFDIGYLDARKLVEEYSA